MLSYFDDITLYCSEDEITIKFWYKLSSKLIDKQEMGLTFRHKNYLQ